MNKFSLSTAGILVAALLTSVSVNAATDNAKTEVTPKGMNCQEFIEPTNYGSGGLLGAQ